MIYNAPDLTGRLYIQTRRAQTPPPLTEQGSDWLARNVLLPSYHRVAPTRPRGSTQRPHEAYSAATRQALEYSTVPPRGRHEVDEYYTSRTNFVLKVVQYLCPYRTAFESYSCESYSNCTVTV